MLTTILRIGRYLHLDTTIFLFAAGGIQALTFILLARGLGAGGFGRLAILQALVQLSLDFVSLGAGEALVRRVSRDRHQYPSALFHAIAMTILTAIPISIVLALLARNIDTSIPFFNILLFTFGEATGNRLGAIVELAFISHSLVRSANLIRIVQAMLKLLSVVVAVSWLSVLQVENWALVQGITTLLASVICLLIAIRQLGVPRVRLHLEDLGFGFFMATSHLSVVIQGAADRLLLGLFAGAEVAGVYSAAMRGVQFGLIPVQGVLRNSFPAFFSAGAQGVAGTYSVARGNLKKVFFIGSLVAIILICAADLLAMALGHGFADTSKVLRWLAFVPLFQGVQYTLDNSVSGADRPLLVTLVNAFGTALFVFLVAGLARPLGIAGAVIAVYTSQLCVISIYAALLWNWLRREKMVKRHRDLTLQAD